MKKMTKLQKRIMQEEFARAMMIMEAKKHFNERGMRIFMTELRKYEENLVITEANRGNIYEGFFGRVANLMKGGLATLKKKLTPDSSNQAEKLADQLHKIDADMEVEEGGAEPDQAKLKKLAAERDKVLQALAKINPELAKTAQKVVAQPNSAGGGAGGDGAGAEPAVGDNHIDEPQTQANDQQQAQANNQQQQQAQAGGGAGSNPPVGDNDVSDLGQSAAQIKDPKAKGFFSNIFNSIKKSYTKGFELNANVLDALNNWVLGMGRQPANVQRQAMQNMQQNMQQAGGVNAVAGNDSDSSNMDDIIDDTNQETEDETGADLPDTKDPKAGDGEEAEAVIAIRKGKNSLQSRLSKLFPDLAKKKGTHYYRKPGKKPGEEGPVVSKHTSALSAIINDIIAQIEGQGITVNESLALEVIDAVYFVSNTNKLLLERSDLARFKTNIQVATQKIRDNEAYKDDPKKKRKALTKFFYRLKNAALNHDKKGDEGGFKKLPIQYPGIAAIQKLEDLYIEFYQNAPKGQKKNAGEVRKKAADYAAAYAKKQITQKSPDGEFQATVLGDARKDSPTKTKRQMAKMVPKVKKGIINLSQIIGTKLKASGFDLKSKEGADLQKRLLKVLRRYLSKELERIGKDNEIKVLAKFSRSQPKKGKQAVNESVRSQRERYLDYYSRYMLKGIINELSNK